MKRTQGKAKFLQMAVLLSVLAVSLPHEVFAKRMSGGKSIGRTPTYSQKMDSSRSAVPPSQSSSAFGAQKSTASSTAPAAGQPASATRRSGWMGALGGLAAGLGLAALLSHFGLGAGLADALGSMLLIALVVGGGIFLIRMLMRNSRSREPLAQAAGSSSTFRHTPVEPEQQGFSKQANPSTFDRNFNTSSAPEPVVAQPVYQAPVSAGLASHAIGERGFEVPAGFDEAAFLSQAKQFFRMLQKAFDGGDRATLKQYCTDEFFAEIQKDLPVTQAGHVSSEILALEANLVGFTVFVSEHEAEVMFDAKMTDAESATPQVFNELWVLVRAADSSGGWLLAGINNAIRVN